MSDRNASGGGPPDGGELDYETAVSASASSTLRSMSTREFAGTDHVPWEIYKTFLPRLCQAVWPEVDPARFEIERMRGGGYNRITGITIKPAEQRWKLLRSSLGRVLAFVWTNPWQESPEPSRYILRVPRGESRPGESRLLLYHVALNQCAGEQTGCPVANIVHYNPSSWNPIGAPYMIQDRLDGSSVLDAFHSLNREQKNSLVHEFATALKKIRTKIFPASGVLDAAAYLSSGEVLIRQYGDLLHAHRYGSHRKDSPVAMQQSVLDLLLGQVEFWKASEYCNDWDADRPWYNRLKEIVIEMGQLGLFEDSSSYLTHLDLEPRNIVVKVLSPTAVSITILDWDSAVFAPSFVGCRAPDWLWAWIVDDPGCTSITHQYLERPPEAPHDDEGRERKRIFEEIMGEEYLRYSYLPQYRVARVIWKMLVMSVSTSWTVDEADGLIEEWRAMWAGLGPAVQEESASGGVLPWWMRARIGEEKFV